jgi:hypothetical protein
MEAETITRIAKHIVDTAFETSASSDVGNRKTNPGYAGGRFI